MKNKKFVGAFMFFLAGMMLVDAVLFFTREGVTSFAGWAQLLAMVALISVGIMNMREQKQ